jgi:hypothetical protein
MQVGAGNAQQWGTSMSRFNDPGRCSDEPAVGPAPNMFTIYRITSRFSISDGAGLKREDCQKQRFKRLRIHVRSKLAILPSRRESCANSQSIGKIPESDRLRLSGQGRYHLLLRITAFTLSLFE